MPTLSLHQGGTGRAQGYGNDERANRRLYFEGARWKKRPKCRCRDKLSGDCRNLLIYWKRGVNCAVLTTHALSFVVTNQETNLQQRAQSPPAPHASLNASPNASPNAIPDPAPKVKPRAVPRERMDPVRQKQAVAPRDAEMTIHDKTTSSLTVMNDLRSRFPVSWVEL